MNFNNIHQNSEAELYHNPNLEINVSNGINYDQHSIKLSPIETISLDVETIIDIVSAVLIGIGSEIFTQQGRMSLFRIFSNEERLRFKLNIMKDMSILAKDGLVTFELAKVIYQIATSDYYVSDEIVLSYYQEVLGGIYFCNNHNLYIWFKEDAEVLCE